MGGGAVRGSEGDPAAATDLASGKRYQAPARKKRHFFPQLPGGGGAAPLPPARYGPVKVKVNTSFHINKRLLLLYFVTGMSYARHSGSDQPRYVILVTGLFG